MNRVIRFTLLAVAISLVAPPVLAQQTVFDDVFDELQRKANLGKLSENPYDPDSTANKYGRYGSPYSSNSVNNQFGKFGSPFSSNSANNPFASDSNAPMIIGSDGKYLGRLSSNPFGADSISNPFGRYGSKYSPDSVNNPFGKYGSPYSPNSARNPYATSPPRIYAPSNGPSFGLPSLPKLPELPKLFENR